MSKQTTTYEIISAWINSCFLITDYYKVQTFIETKLKTDELTLDALKDLLKTKMNELKK